MRSPRDTGNILTIRSAPSGIKKTQLGLSVTFTRLEYLFTPRDPGRRAPAHGLGYRPDRRLLPDLPARPAADTPGGLDRNQRAGTRQRIARARGAAAHRVLRRHAHHLRLAARGAGLAVRAPR